MRKRTLKYTAMAALTGMMFQFGFGCLNDAYQITRGQIPVGFGRDAGVWVWDSFVAPLLEGITNPPADGA